MAYRKNSRSYNEYYVDDMFFPSVPPSRSATERKERASGRGPAVVACPSPRRPHSGSILEVPCSREDLEEAVVRMSSATSTCKQLISAAPFPPFSRLNPRLAECLSSNYCLPYFIQFLEYCKSLSLIHFLFACETFRKVAESADQELHTSNCDVNCVHKIGSPSKSIKSSIQHDALDIYVQYISMNASHSISFPENIRQNIENHISTEDGNVDYGCFDSAMDYVRQCLTSVYLPKFYNSSFCTEYRVNVLCQDLVLADILQWDTSLIVFMEFLERHGHENHSLFWISVQAFQNHLKDVGSLAPNIEDVGPDAIALYDTYLSLQARKPVNYGRIIRGIVESSISPDDDIITPDAFLIAQQYSYHYMDKMFFDSFKKSETYKAFIVEQQKNLSAQRSEERNLKLASKSRTVVPQQGVVGKVVDTTTAPPPKPTTLPPQTPPSHQPPTPTLSPPDSKSFSRLHQVIQEDKKIAKTGSTASSSKASSPRSSKRSHAAENASECDSNKGNIVDILDDCRIGMSTLGGDYRIGAVDEWGVYNTEDKHLLNSSQQGSDKIKKSVMKLFGKEEVSEEDAIAQAKSIVSDVMNLTNQPLNLEDLLTTD